MYGLPMNNGDKHQLLQEPHSKTFG